MALLLVAGFAANATPPELTLRIDRAASDSVVVGFETVDGTDYVVHASPDLRNWAEVGEPLAGDGAYQEVPLPAAGAEEFFRVTRAAYWDAFVWDEYVWR
ncbi:MAG: hypothetical protein KDM81_10500 [Verrucomicrobiae bacterium]|nr:hypothetical protein [Verrucomicrobiae bacterium]